MPQERVNFNILEALSNYVREQNLRRDVVEALTWQSVMTRLQPPKGHGTTGQAVKNAIRKIVAAMKRAEDEETAATILGQVKAANVGKYTKVKASVTRNEKDERIMILHLDAIPTRPTEKDPE